MNTKTVAITLSVAALILLTGAFPKKTSYDSSWSRTAMTVNGPRGAGCVVYNSAVATAVLMQRNGTPIQYQLPIQLRVVNTATSAVIVCATQDATPTIARDGFFSADTYFSAGPGICLPLAAGSTDYFGVPSDGFSGGSGTTRPVGSGPASMANLTYVAVVNPAGAGSSDVFLCEVE